MSSSLQRILIWGKTYPELSWNHKETVCAGGCLEDGTPVRLYPVPLRLLPELTLRLGRFGTRRFAEAAGGDVSTPRAVVLAGRRTRTNERLRPTLPLGPLLEAGVEKLAKIHEGPTEPSEVTPIATGS